MSRAVALQTMAVKKTEEEKSNMPGILSIIAVAAGFWIVPKMIKWVAP